ncbi:molybdenum cofactor guanylyltransferase [Bacillus sp. DJP31]|uniref:molybdenum cofactor guanylyltransferase n=1 Tax=Bacillus sp. DJP31 TaxID=3409789 RepID=UPI003BB7587E
MEYDVCGVILAGGESRRFGAPKAFAQFKEVPFWEYSFKALEEVTNTQVIVSHPSLVDRFKMTTNLPVIVDDNLFQGNGPMAGIFSAMKHVKADWYMVLSCDIPAIQNLVITELLTQRDEAIQAIIPVIEGRVQPLVGLYHCSIYPKIKELLLSKSFRLMSLLKEVNVRYVNETDLMVDSKVFQNINDIDALTNLNHEESSID